MRHIEIFCVTAVVASCRAFPVMATASKGWIVPEGVAFGSLDRLVLDDYETRCAEGDTVKVATRAVGLNFADIFTTLGLYAAANAIRGGKAFCPGLEYAGTVLEGDPGGEFKPGDRVLGVSRFGAYADVVESPTAFLVPLPPSWSFIQGASFVVQALTAWHGLVEVGQMPNLKSKSYRSLVGDNHDRPYIVVVHSAAGGVGLWASEIAARRGATVIGIVGNENKAKTFTDRILPLAPNSKAMVRGDEKTFGVRLARLVLEMRGESSFLDLSSVKKAPWVAIRERGAGVDFVMESLGGQYYTESFEAVNSGGALVTFGSTTYANSGLGISWLHIAWRYLTRPTVDPLELPARNIRLAGYNLIYLTEQRARMRKEVFECIACLAGAESVKDEKQAMKLLDKVTPPTVGDVFDFRTAAVEAMAKLKSGSTVGKVVLDNYSNPALPEKLK